MRNTLAVGAGGLGFLQHALRTALAEKASEGTVS